MKASLTYARYLCDVCSAPIGQRGYVRFSFDGQRTVTDARCRPHRPAKIKSAKRSS